MSTTGRTREQFRLRTRLILGVALIGVALILVRLYFVQIVEGEGYRLQANEQYVSTSGGFYDRGKILFQYHDGITFGAATIDNGYLLAITPSEIEEPAALYRELSAIVPLDEAHFRERAARKEDPYEEIAHRLTDAQARAVRDKKLDGVLIVPERWRYYPGESLAAHTIGFVAYDGDELVGRYGLERYFEDVLERGESKLHVNFFAELFTNLRDVVFVPVDEREGDIVATIEPTVQSHLEDVLDETREAWGSRFTAGIVIDPQTGAIRALAVSPAFNLNEFGQVDVSQYSNPVVEGVYELGSIFKPLTMAAALDSGAVTPESTYNDTGTRRIDDYTIANYDREARGVVPVQEILSQSLNLGAAHLVDAMGKGVFRRYMYRFGLNEETGVDLPNEALGLTDNLTSPREIEYATAAFGQGIALTPIAMARALAALPDGYLEQPHVAEEIRTRTGGVHELSYNEVREQVLKPETAEEISRMLVKVYDEALADGEVKMERYSIAAKTGTAQIPSPDGGYYEDRYLHTFFGYFPAFDAKYLVFLMNMEPKGAQYASQTLTDPFVDLTHFLINYYDIPPDR